MRFTRVALSLLVPLVNVDVATGFAYQSSLNSFNIHTHHRTISRPQPLLLSTAVNGDSTSSELLTSTPAEPIKLTTPEKARTVTSICTSGTLCTSSISSGIEGAPFGSYVDYVLDDDGNPVLLMNEMSMHTINIRETKKDSPPLVTLFTQLGKGNSGQDVSRCSVTGVISEISSDAGDIDVLKMRYAINHVYADRVMDSPKFHFYRIVPAKIYFVGGFGVDRAWVSTDEYKVAKPDILAREAADIVEKLNRDNGRDLELVGSHLLEMEDLEDVVITSVDRLGVDIRVTTRMRRNKLVTNEFRVGFRIPVISVEDAKSEILKIFQESWEKGQGYTWGGDELPGSDVPILKIAEDGLG